MSIGAFGENFPYTNFHNLNMDWIIKVIREVKETYPDLFEELRNTKISKPTENPNGNLGDYLISNGDGTTSWKPLDTEIAQEIVETVNQWLEDHPEATTTVQDGAITYPKLDNELKNVVYNPDTETGTDYQKLQVTINKAIQNENATIILTRMYDITGFTLMINKGLYDETTHVRKKLTFIGLNKGGIQKQDSGYIFSGNQPSTGFTAGDVQCINVYFKGATVYQDIDKDGFCSVFDCHRIIRITTIGCSYWNLGTVFDGHECTTATNNMQQVANIGDVCTYSHAYYKLGTTWVVNAENCIIEQCDYGIVSVYSPITSLHLFGCTIEGCRYEAIRLLEENNHESASDIVIENCYFEGNSIERTLKRDIYLHFYFTYGVTIKNNHFATTGETYHCIDIYLRNDQYDIDNNTCSASSTATTLVYFDIADAPTSITYLIYYHNNYAGSGLVTNNTDIFRPYRQYVPANLNGLVANNLPSDINNLGTASLLNTVINILDTDNATNLPGNETSGSLITYQSSPGNAIQIFSNPSTLPWIRTRKSGYGWSSWKPLNGNYCFAVNNLRHGDTVNLPIYGFSMLVTAYSQYTSASQASVILPCIVVSANETSFTFRALDPVTKTPSSETGLAIVFTIQPMV